MKETTFTRVIPVMGLSVLLLSACGNATTADEVSVNETPPDTPSQTMASTQATVDGAMPSMTVYKSPNCGCCQAWVDYMAAKGFTVNGINTEEVDTIKAEHGLTSPDLKSCHTAIIDGYVIEGHVPADDVKRLLDERPKIVGLTAPGMPMMSPGMSSLTPEDYDVLAFDEKGRTRVWSSY